MNRSQKPHCSIADLPVEVVLTIFKLLDYRSQLNVSASCKSWKILTARWLKWSLFAIPAFDSVQRKALMKTKRQFVNIVLKGDVSLRYFSQMFMQMFSQLEFGGVTSMTINSMTVELLDFNNLLKLFPNLKSLEIYAVSLPENSRSNHQLTDVEKPIFGQLTHLSFGNLSDSRLLQCFTNARLERLVCREQSFSHSRIWKLLSTQSDLKEIDFCRRASNSTFRSRIDPCAVTFTLKKIALDYKQVSDFHEIEKLLLRQSDSVETLELGHLPDTSVYTTIFSRLNNLTTLHVMPGSVHYEMNDKLVLQPLLSITSLRLYYGLNYGLNATSIRDMTIQLLENVPNCENLELLEPYNQVHYNVIVENLKKLKSVTIRVTFDTELADLLFPSVETLRINCYDHPRYNYPNIQPRAHEPISMVMERTEFHETVRSLIYEGVTSQGLVNFIRDTFPKLERLEVRRDYAKCKYTTVTGIRVVRYRDKDFFAQRMRFDQEIY